ncbi:hypothetical protein DSO57_1007075 [Entomophthora muscae]|uniref:Uncharacterized protein n=1 Tax=Entomophthora muscae TaxID=34485 RepID=A0ACC2RYS6_9FUNG|nr:hypothetical protein DSO57_1007075 [Entomophthora muscae]
MVARSSFYPLEGIKFFLFHPSLWKKCFCGLVIMVIVALGSLVGFSFLISPTSNLLKNHGWPGWLAIIMCILFMIVESALFTIIFSLIFLPILQDQIFAHTIKLKGYKESILDRPAQGMGWKIFIGSIAYALIQVLTMLLTIPLHLIPVFGTITYCYVNGLVFAWGLRLSDLMPFRGLSFTQTRHHVLKNKWEYMSFGSVAFALEMIPFLNWIFIFTNVVGAALWAIDDSPH